MKNKTQSHENIENKCEVLEKEEIGYVRFTHSNYSGYEKVTFYKDKNGRIYHQAHFVDPFDDTERLDKLRPCKLNNYEVENLVKKKTIENYPRFYCD